MNKSPTPVITFTHVFTEGISCKLEGFSWQFNMVFKIPYIVIEPYAFLFVAHTALTAVTLPQFLLDKVCQRNFNSTVCSNIKDISFKEEQDLVQKQTALWLTSIQSTMAGLTTLATLFIGPLADTIGIRKTMFITPVFTGIYFIILIILTSLRESFHPALVLASVPFAAACGEFSGASTLASSYIAMVTDPKDRTFRLAFASAAFSFAAFLFGIVSGYLLNWVGYIGVFVVCLILCVLNGLYLLMFVSDAQPPDSCREADVQDQQQPNSDEKAVSSCKRLLVNDDKEKEPHTENENIEPMDAQTESEIKQKPKEDDRVILSDTEHKQRHSKTAKFKTSLAESNPVTKFKEVYRYVTTRKQRITVLSLMFAVFVAALAWHGELSVLVLFINNRPLNFNAVDTGYFIAFQGINWAVIGYVVINSIFQRWFRCSDYLVITISLLAHAVYLTLLGFSTSKIVIYVIQLVSALAALDLPTIHSSLTKIVAPNKYATILAACGTLQSIGGLATFSATVIYAEFISIHRGAAFFFLALFLLVSVITSGRLLWKERVGNPNGDYEKQLEADIPKEQVEQE